ncbi:hypothetical protein AB0442_04745 [Kitasatospora sp. NPDC085895]|uniref:hypothetical protein n=1 Tax=Kitasatospora sp. NPDC085895 TaxID=3155057 RepID=UPI0034508F6B
MSTQSEDALPEEALPEDAPEETAPKPAGRRRRTARRRRRPAVVLAGALAAVAVGFALWTAPTTREILLDSFTERPRTYAELFFTATPGFEGSTVVVPVAVTDHGEGSQGYRVRVTLESPSGQVLASSTTPLKAHYGAPVPLVAKLQTNADVALVRVALVGHPQSLYFRFGKSQTPHG